MIFIRLKESFSYSFIFLSLLILGTSTFTVACNRSVPVYRVMIDPGHGGTGIKDRNGHTIKSDKWDPVTQSYLSYYGSGMEADGFKEYQVVLSLAKKVKFYIDQTQTPWGWKKFQTLLRQFSDQKNFPQVIFETAMTRVDNWEDNYTALDLQDKMVNNRYRLYDFPDMRGRILPGRISWINYFSPSLLVSLHMTPAGTQTEGGMAAVLVPGFETYDMIRAIHLGKEDIEKWENSPWNGKILETETGWSQFELMRGDTWCYFHGYRSDKEGEGPNYEAARGIRYNLVRWRYSEDGWSKNYDTDKPGPYSLRYESFQPTGRFWDRERGQAEQWRREGGALGYGGDNHYAADELMRFVQYGFRQLPTPTPSSNKIGKILPPFVSSYSLPNYINAVTAFLEIGHLNRELDRNLVIQKQKLVAQSIAVGIYSLYMGIKLKPLPEIKEILSISEDQISEDQISEDQISEDQNQSNTLESEDTSQEDYLPRTQRLNFDKYRSLPEGDYFKLSRK